jgi:hypothetical protein
VCGIKKQIYILIILVVVFPTFYLSQEQPKVSGFRLNANLALIISNAHAHVPNKEQTTSNSIAKTSRADTGSNYKPGFLIGADALFFPGENFKGLLGVSFSRTAAEYHYSFYSVGETSRPGFTQIERYTEYDYGEKYSMLNFQAGIRNRLNDDFFLTSSFLLNHPLSINREYDGYTESVYTNNSGGRESDKVFIEVKDAKIKKGDPNISFRLNVEYQFEIGKSLARAYIFRNFGLKLKLPWWGLGISYSIKR